MMSEKRHDYRDRAGRTPLHYAVADNELEKVRNLLAAGADPNAKEREGLTPLHAGAQLTDTGAVIRLLLDSGADPNALDNLGRNPLMVAVASSKSPLIQSILLNAGSDPHHEGTNHYSPANYIERFGTGEEKNVFAVHAVGKGTMSIDYDSWREPEWDTEEEPDVDPVSEAEKKRQQLREMHAERVHALRGSASSHSGVKVQVTSEGHLVSVHIPESATTDVSALEQEIVDCSRRAIGDVGTQVIALARQVGQILAEISPADARSVEFADALLSSFSPEAMTNGDSATEEPDS